ncbi:MAG: sensor histidine kinase, partial [Ignavibacteriales bacterium]
SMVQKGQVQNEKTYQGTAEPPASLDLHFVPFTQGMLYVGNTVPLTEAELDLVKTLTEAFSIAYARYEDFKNLEEAKNKIEVTLKELKSAQVQLIHSEKMASLGELTAGIAHEIKNPLNFVNNFSEISGELLDEMKTELLNNNNKEAISIAEELKQNLEKINQHGKRADSIVKGMLLHSRGTSGEKTLTDINDLLEQYVNLAYHGMRAQDKDFNIKIEKDYDENLEKINVVPQDISRVFLNIINNACYAAYDKKKKSIDDFSPTLKVSTKNLKDKVEIRISDNGNGIPDSIKKQIFNPFFTTKPTGEGTGLGLSLSYDIVTKLHNGNISFVSEDQKYTEFIITLPKS